jgi:ribosomal-protein-alanine N-acetyltransferase
MTTLHAPARLVTDRLVLRRPVSADAETIFTRYASDPNVTRFVGWPRHATLGDTQAFLAYADQEWNHSPSGPYIIEDRKTSIVLGSTGLSFETPYRAATGYVLAVDAWGHGFATEALQAMVDVAGQLHLRRLYALCHVDHVASARVLEKCGFACEGVLRRHTEFPNLSPPEVCDVRCYSRVYVGRGFTPRQGGP